MAYYSLINLDGKELAIMPHPATEKGLSAEITYLAQQGFHCIVSLLTESEVSELKLDNEQQLVLAGGMDFISFPIKDKSVPDNTLTFAQLVEDIKCRLAQQQRIVIHCWAGIGRSGMLASAVLASMGLEINQAFDKVTELRGEKVPETEEQVQWLTTQFIPSFTQS